jgi:hypothetical protein
MGAFYICLHVPEQDDTKSQERTLGAQVWAQDLANFSFFISVLFDTKHDG